MTYSWIPFGLVKLMKLKIGQSHVVWTVLWTLVYLLTARCRHHSVPGPAAAATFPKNGLLQRACLMTSNTMGCVLHQEWWEVGGWTRNRKTSWLFHQNRLFHQLWAHSAVVLQSTDCIINCSLNWSHTFSPVWKGKLLSIPGSMPPNCTPGTSVEYSMMSLDTTTAPEGLGVDSPIPPVLTTPGIKQIEHLPTARYVQTPSKKDLDDSDSSPFPPTFVTPGLKPLPRIDRQPLPSEVPVLAYDDEDEEDKSPVPPVLKTPGAKQIGKPGVIQPTSGISSDDPNSGTPQSPNLMLNYQVRSLSIGQMMLVPVRWKTL